MASGQINVSTNNQYINGKITWSSTTDINNNQSTVTATLYLSRNNTGYTTSGSGTFTLNINGNSKSNSASFTISYNSNTVMVTHSVVVPHNADGSMSIVISCSGGMPGTSLTSTSGSATVALDTIPRASSITAFPNFNIDGSSSITISRASANFTHTLVLKVGNTTVATRTGIGASTTFALTVAEQDIIYQSIPASTSVTVTLYCTTYNSGSQIGSTTSKTATASVSASIVPTFTTITTSEANTAVSTNVGSYVQTLSKLNLAITGATGAKFSTIQSYKIVFDGSTYNTASATTEAIKGSGSLTITGTITDSRGRTASKSVTVTVLAYAVPRITTFDVTRCNSDGTANDLGTYVKVTSTGSVSSLLNGSTQKNNLTYKILSKARTTTTWTTKKTATIVNLSLSASDILSVYDVLSSFDFRLEITDKFNTTIAIDILPTGQVVLSWSKTGVGVGKVWEQGTLDVGGDIYESGTKLSAKYSAINHTHSTYALTSHGYHVPTPQTANDAVYLRNDNTWQTITPSKIGGVAKAGDTMTGTLSAPTIKSDTYGFITSGVNGTITGRSDSGFDFNLAGGWRITFDGSARCIYTYNPNGGVWTRIAG